MLKFKVSIKSVRERNKDNLFRQQIAEVNRKIIKYHKRRSSDDFVKLVNLLNEINPLYIEVYFFENEKYVGPLRKKLSELMGECKQLWADAKMVSENAKKYGKMKRKLANYDA